MWQKPREFDRQARDMGSGVILTQGNLLSFQACVQNFSESPLWLLEKIKNVFSEMKNLLKDKRDIFFGKNCTDSFAECSSQGKHQRAGKCEAGAGIGGGWDVGLEGPQGGSLAATRAPVCVDVLVLCTYMALCTSGWS